MPSLSKKTYRRRRRKRAAQARRRKRAVRNLGTTPPFSIHPEVEKKDSRKKEKKSEAGGKKVK